MNKNIAFPNNQSNEKQSLPKSMVKGKAQQKPITEETVKHFAEADKLFDELSKKEKEALGQMLRLEKLKELMRYRYLVNDDVNEYYENIEDFFTRLGGVNETDRTPNPDGSLNVKFCFTNTINLEQKDLEELSDIMFRVSDNFKMISSQNGEDKLVVMLQLHGYYTKEENVEVSEWVMQ